MARSKLELQKIVRWPLSRSVVNLLLIVNKGALIAAVYSSTGSACNLSDSWERLCCCLPDDRTTTTKAVTTTMTTLAGIASNSTRPASRRSNDRSSSAASAATFCVTPIPTVFGATRTPTSTSLRLRRFGGGCGRWWKRRPEIPVPSSEKKGQIQFN